ncbi:MAG: hypothetical protein GWN29_12680 [Gammaproteobacteria bacterium]|nr:hypothetical protein [Gammaproteobacteria bacterium]
MEIILLWLDDLDDLVFAVVYAVERLRWAILEIGFAAACGLAVVSFADVLVSWVPALFLTALASVMFWLAALLARELSRIVADPQRLSTGESP